MQRRILSVPLDVGQRQKDIQDERYEYLRVAMGKEYFVGPGPSSSLDRQSCRTITFPSRPDLSTVREFKPYFASAAIHPSSQYPPRFESLHGRPAISSETGAFESIIGLADVKHELDLLETDERYREGGLLYLVGHQNLFWTLVLVWHRSGTSGHDGWDFVLHRAQDASNKQNIDCMFYCTPFGCRIKNCEFLHSKPRKDACELFALQNAQMRLAADVASLDTLVEEPEVDDEDIVAVEVRQEREYAAIRKAQRNSSMSSRSSEGSKLSDETLDAAENPESASTNTSPIPYSVYRNKLGRLSAASFAMESANIVAEVSREQRNIFCHTCGQQEPVGCKYKLCSKCKQVRYCGRECQEADWKNGHSKICRSFRK